MIATSGEAEKGKSYPLRNSPRRLTRKLRSLRAAQGHSIQMIEKHYGQFVPSRVIRNNETLYLRMSRAAVRNSSVRADPAGSSISSGRPGGDDSSRRDILRKATLMAAKAVT